jgi:hypothetical protein
MFFFDFAFAALKIVYNPKTIARIASNATLVNMAEISLVTSIYLSFMYSLNAVNYPISSIGFIDTKHTVVV